MTMPQATIEERLQKLERQNRIIKTTGLGVLLIASAFLFMGQARPARPGNLTATAFVLVDAHGQKRATLDTSNDEAASLKMYSANGRVEAQLSVFAPGPMFALSGTDMKTNVWVAAFSDVPAVDLTDAQGFSTNIGVTDLLTPTTGETHKTSAASVILFGKDKKVLWSAP